MSTTAILRRWRSRIRKEQASDYVNYIRATGLREYAEAPGNRGCQILLRDLGDGTMEVTTLSWWTDLDAIRAFAGKDIGKAVYYPEDDHYLLEKPLHVEHHEVVAGEFPLISPTSTPIGR